MDLNKIIKLKDTLDKKKYIELIIYEYYKNINFFEELTKKFEDKFDTKMVETFSKYKEVFLYAIKKLSIINLLGKEEINDTLATNTKYYTIICNNDLALKSFKVFLYLYYIDSIIEKELYLPIDYEFNTKKIALMQLNFEGGGDKRIDSFIYIIYPFVLDEKSYSFFINKILNNKNIYYLLHGSDSLDIPSTYTDIFKNDKEKIIKFTQRLVDTKYLCEYYHLDKDIKKRCKIKELLLELNIITDKKLNQLIKNEEEMGNISDILIDINTLSKELLKYSLYDVIFLKYLFIKFINMDKHIYKYLIPEITRFVYLERREIIKFTEKIDNIVYRLNIAKIDTMDDILDGIFMTLLYSIYNKKIMNIFEINYFKRHFINILKCVTYSILAENYKINMPNNTVFEGYINIGSLFKKLRNYNFFTIFNLLNMFKEELNKYLI